MSADIDNIFGRVVDLYKATGWSVYPGRFDSWCVSSTIE